ncbi:hypothetical protein FQN60_004631 [Etheostoma spectabile]|uniref:Uncharacterized protein n=1 Tax=Etheostoma spectabile TaxID=54343 RepID=A0A5J5DK67_9PERO|nr:hypothetical protein FQN60_004631 [Etheostoma spectabile]
MLQRGCEVETATRHSSCLGHIHISVKYTQNTGYTNKVHVLYRLRDSGSGLVLSTATLRPSFRARSHADTQFCHEPRKPTATMTSVLLEEKSFFFFPGAQFSGRPAASVDKGSCSVLRMSSTLDLKTSGLSLPLAIPIWLVKNTTCWKRARVD